MIRIVIGDDEDMIRSALAALLDLEDDIDVVGQAGDGDTAFELVRSLRPDVVVLDLEMPPDDGIVTASRVRGLADQDTKVLVVTRHARPGVLRRALQAGVTGFVPKATEATLLADVVREVAAGRRHIDSEVAAIALGASASPLSDRETDVLLLAGKHASAAEIAERLSLAPGTVRNYLSSAMAKVGSSNRHAAAEEARRRGWI